MENVVYTIGHSIHPIEKFTELLHSQSITAVCDVRSSPYSRMNPQFNREALKRSLRQADIKYVFLGAELGARSEDKNCYRNGQVQYDLLAQTDLFKWGIHRVKDGAKSYRVALMCAEKEPLDCHRTILVARKLSDEGIRVRHILADGRIEEHSDTIRRLTAKLGLPDNDMFRSRDSIIAEAYAVRANEIAYQEKEAERSDQSDSQTLLRG